MKMNFSEAFRHGNKQCKIAPNGRYLATAIGFRLVVRDMTKLQIQKLFACVDDIEQIQWSGDSKFILCCLRNRGILQVWWMEDPVWRCKIEEGASGLTDVCWSPDSRHIITTADFHLRLTIWSLMSKTISYIKHPKPCKKGIDFSSCGTLMAVAERKNLQDFVSIFATRNWTLVEHFAVHTTDLDRILMSPDSRTLAVCESCLKYGVYLYSIDGALLGRYSAYDNALGIKAACWTSTSQFLAIGSYDQKVRLLNNVTWKPLGIADHPNVVDARSVLVYREKVTRGVPFVSESVLESTGSLFNCKSKYEVLTGDVDLPVQLPDISKACPKIGISHVSFSPDCRYMCTINANFKCRKGDHCAAYWECRKGGHCVASLKCRKDSMNKVVWLWDMKAMHLSTILIQNAPVKDIQWDPSSARLALCTGKNKVYMWSDTGCLAVELPLEGE